MTGTARLLTERLQLRRFRVEDADAAYRNWMSDPEVARFVTWEAHADPEESRRVISGWVGEYASGTMDWCITLRGSDEPIGSITVVREHPDQGYCEVGYCLSQRYWDRGLMTEALKAVVNYVFDTTGYMWIQARYDAENEASGRCLEKCNFHETGVLRLPDPKTGTVRTYRFMALTRGDVMVHPRSGRFSLTLSMLLTASMYFVCSASAALLQSRYCSWHLWASALSLSASSYSWCIFSWAEFPSSDALTAF